MRVRCVHKTVCVSRTKVIIEERNILTVWTLLNILTRGWGGGGGDSNYNARKQIYIYKENSYAGHTKYTYT